MLVKKVVEFCIECWKESHNVLCSPECRKQCLNKEIKGIKTEAMEGAKVNYNMYVTLCLINEETATTDSMRVLIRKARIFKENTGNNKQQDIRKFWRNQRKLNVIV